MTILSHVLQGVVSKPFDFIANTSNKKAWTCFLVYPIYTFFPLHKRNCLSWMHWRRVAIDDEDRDIIYLDDFLLSDNNNNNNNHNHNYKHAYTE